MVGGLHGAGIRGGGTIEANNGTVYSAAYLAGNPAKAHVILGGGEASDRQVMTLVDNELVPGGYSLRFEAGTGDLVCRYANLGGVMPFTITGPNTASPAGPNRLTVPGIGIGFGNQARLFLVGSGQPTSGNWAQGTRIFYDNPVAGGREGVVCVASGSPGTWKEFGSIQA